MVGRLLAHELPGSSSSRFFSETPFPWVEVDRAPESGAQEPRGQALQGERHYKHCVLETLKCLAAV